MRTGSPHQVTYFQMKRPKGNLIQEWNQKCARPFPKDSPGYEPEIVPDGQTVSEDSTAVSWVNVCKQL